MSFCPILFCFKSQFVVIHFTTGWFVDIISRYKFDLTEWIVNSSIYRHMSLKVRRWFSLSAPISLMNWSYKTGRNSSGVYLVPLLIQWSVFSVVPVEGSGGCEPLKSLYLLDVSCSVKHFSRSSQRFARSWPETDLNATVITAEHWNQSHM